MNYSRDELMNLTVPDIEEVVPDYESWKAEIEQLSEDTKMNIKGRHERKNGEIVPVNVETEKVLVNGHSYVIARAEESSVESGPRDAHFHDKFLHYSRFYKNAPIGLIELDPSVVNEKLKELQDSGIDNFENYLDEDHDRVIDLLEYIKFGVINPRLIEIVEARNREHLQNQYLSLFVSDSIPSLKKLLLSFINNVRDVSVEIPIKTLDGTERILQVDMVSTRKTDEFFSEVFLSAVDITERKTQQAKLESRKARYKQLIENVPGMVYRCEYDSEWTMHFVSENTREITGYEASSFVLNKERSYGSIIHPNDRDHVENEVKNAVESDQIFELEYRIRRSDDEIRWVFERGQAVRGSDGEITHLEGVILDITDRKQIKDALEKSENRYRTLFESAEVGLAEVSFDEEWLEVNDYLEEILGYSEHELRDMNPCENLNHPEELERDRRNNEKLLKDQIDSFSVEKRFQKKDGDYIWTRLTASKVESDFRDNPYMISIINDIDEIKETERKLRESERRFRSTFEKAAVGIAHVDLDGSFLRVNDECVELFGYSKDELRNRTFQEITHPDDVEKDLNKLEQLLEGEIDQYALEKQYVRKDGSIFWAQLNVGMVKDEALNPKYFVSVIRDISDRKTVERELKRSEARYRTTFEDAGMGMAHIAPDGSILRTNKRLSDFLGYSEDELRELNVAEITHTDDMEKDREQARKLWFGDIDHYSIEMRYIRKDGSIVWGEISVGKPQTQNEDKPYLIGSVQDITERKHIKKERETFFELSPDLLTIANFDGKFLEVNQAFTDVLGYSKQTLTSKQYLEFIHPDDLDETLRTMKKLEDGYKVESHENRYITKDDEIRWLNWHAVPGEDVIYAVARDVTNRHQYEQRLEEMVEEKETLLKEVHHRVKNNLQVISSLLDMQKRKVDDPEVSATFADSVERVKSMALIHEQLYQSDRLSNVNFEEYIRNLTSHLLSLQGQFSHRIDVTHEIEIKEVELDFAIPMGLILSELISNAFEHGVQSSDDSVRVELKKVNEENVKLTVSDTGNGFPEEFDLNETESLGMKVVRSLAEYELDGIVSVENENGAVIEIEFPLEFYQNE